MKKSVAFFRGISTPLTLLDRTSFNLARVEFRTNFEWEGRVISNGSLIGDVFPGSIAIQIVGGHNGGGSGACFYFSP